MPSKCWQFTSSILQLTVQLGDHPTQSTGQTRMIDFKVNVNFVHTHAPVDIQRLQLDASLVVVSHSLSFHTRLYFASASTHTVSIFWAKRTINRLPKSGHSQVLIPKTAYRRGHPKTTITCCFHPKFTLFKENMNVTSARWQMMDDCTDPEHPRVQLTPNPPFSRKRR